MTEAEWLGCVKPDEMLRKVGRRSNQRKRRLFNCGCCRRAWHLIADVQVRAVVEAIERACEGPWRWKGVDLAAEAAHGGPDAAMSSKGAAADAAWAAFHAAIPNLWSSRAAAKAVAAGATGRSLRTRHAEERAAQAGLIREIFGNPFRPVLAEQSWLAWNDGTIPKMAQVIYDARAFDRLPLLADSLEDASCDNQEILDHCRSNGEHVRGCWVVDLLLGKS